MQRFRLMPLSPQLALPTQAKAAYRFWVAANCLANSEFKNSKLKFRT
jgi:hypothetical protein